MSTLQQLRSGLHEVWDTLLEGWQRLYRKATAAITRFTPGDDRHADDSEEGRELAVRNLGWGVLAAEVFDDDERVVVRLEAPGIEAGNFDIEVVDDYLIVRGEKRIERERREGRYHITECAYGRFERAVPLPGEVDPAQASARYRDGVLRIELPKVAAARRRRITVDAG